jgi:hypothetical protein
LFPQVLSIPLKFYYFTRVRICLFGWSQVIVEESSEASDASVVYRHLANFYDFEGTRGAAVIAQHLSIIEPCFCPRRHLDGV